MVADHKCWTTQYISGSTSVSFLLMYFRFFDKNLSLDSKTVENMRPLPAFFSSLYDVIGEAFQMNSARRYRFTVR